MCNKKSRRFQVTVNNPIEKGITADKIKEILKQWKHMLYYCFCYETGEQGTYHVHIYFKVANPLSMHSVSKEFANGHVECIKASSSQENRDYIRKEGAYLDSEKAATCHRETFFESGPCPVDGKEKQGERTDIETMMSLIRDGAGNMEICDEVPSMSLRLSAVEQYRQAYFAEQGKTYRQMTVWYVFGKTRTGKTSYVYQSHDADEICSITDYRGNGIWDQYDTARTRVLLLDEFHSSIPFSLLLAICDGQPLTLNCRYANRVCLHDTVYIVSNISLLGQYPEERRNRPERWEALLARISNIRYYSALGKYKDYTVEKYLKAEKNGEFSNFSFCDDKSTPFSRCSEGSE